MVMYCYLHSSLPWFLLCESKLMFVTNFTMYSKADFCNRNILPWCNDSSSSRYVLVQINTTSLYVKVCFGRSYMSVHQYTLTIVFLHRFWRQQDLLMNCRMWFSQMKGMCVIVYWLVVQLVSVSVGCMAWNASQDSGWPTCALCLLIWGVFIHILVECNLCHTVMMQLETLLNSLGVKRTGEWASPTPSKSSECLWHCFV